jgi:hypothetical protein
MPIEKRQLLRTMRRIVGRIRQRRHDRAWHQSCQECLMSAAVASIPIPDTAQRAMGISQGIDGKQPDMLAGTRE